jgi:parallel beta-helix repeat protein
MLLDHSSDNNTITGNNLSASEQVGLRIDASNGNMIENNDCSFNNDTGISFRDSSDSNMLQGNWIMHNDRGVVMKASENNSLFSNQFYRNNYSVDMESCSNNTLDGNHIQLSLTGFHLLSSSDNLLANNTVECLQGFILDGSYGNELRQNMMNGGGIHLTGDKETFSSQVIPSSNLINGLPVLYLNNEEGPVVDGDPAGEIILGNVTSAIIENLAISGGSMGFCFGYSSDLLIINNQLTSNDVGMYLEQVSDSQIDLNELTFNGEGIRSTGVGDLSLEMSDNQFTGNLMGAIIQGQDNTTMMDNLFTSNDFGVQVIDSDNNLWIGDEHLDMEEVGMELIGGSGNTLASCNMSGGKRGIFALDSVELTVEGCVFDTCEWGVVSDGNSIDAVVRDSLFHGNQFGVLIDGARNNTVIDNQLDNNSQGVCLISANGNLIVNNTLLDNMEGIYLASFSSNSITGNNMSGNNASIYLSSSLENGIEDNLCNMGFVGIQIIFSDNNTLINNSCFLNNHYGMALQHCDGCQLYSNLISENLNHGLGIIDTTGTEVRYNNFTSNDGHAVYLISGMDNSFSHNLFAGNNGAGGSVDASHVQCYDAGDGNNWTVWDGSQDHGNYWSDLSNPAEDEVYKLAGPAHSVDTAPLSMERLRLPSAPTDLEVNANGSESDPMITVSWSAPVFDGGESIDEYTISRLSGDGSWSNTTVASSLSRFNDHDIEVDMEYTYWVAAVNMFGEGAASVPMNITFVLVPPSPPIELEALMHVDVNTANVNVSWEEPLYPGPGVEGYMIYLDGLYLDSTEERYFETELINGEEYNITVVAYNGQGVSGPSDGLILNPMYSTSSIAIDGNLELVTFAEEMGLEGHGTPSSPYIIRGLSIASPDGCIYIGNTTLHLRIESCSLESYGGGEHATIVLLNTRNIDLISNEIITNIEGMRITSSSSISMESNDVMSTTTALYMGLTSEVDVLDNELYGGERCFEMWSSSGNLLEDNVITGGSIGLYLASSSDNRIHDCTCSMNDQGMYMSSSRNNTLVGMRFHDNDLDGLVLANSSDRNTVMNSAFEGFGRSGVSMSGSSQNTLDHLEMSGGQFGVEMVNGSMLNSVNSSTFDNLVHAFWIENSTLNELHGNTMSECSIMLTGDEGTFDTQTIGQDNLVNGLPVMYHKRGDGVTETAGEMGQLIVGNVDGMVIEGVIVGDASVGACIGYSDDVEMTESLFSSSLMGVYIEGCEMLDVTGSWWQSNGEGIVLVRSQGTIDSCDFTGNGRGVALYDTEGSVINNGDFQSNLVGIVVESGGWNVIHGCSHDDTNPVILNATGYNEISGAEIVGSERGVQVIGSNWDVITSSLFDGCEVGVSVNGSENTTVNRVHLIGCEVGMHLHNGSFCAINENTIEECSTGIVLNVTVLTDIMENEIFNGSVGIDLVTTGGSLIALNHCQKQEEGISSHDSVLNMIVENTCEL